jgi:gluconolactonase
MFYGEIEGGGFEVVEHDFRACFVGHARLERLWTGCRWAEGPALVGGGRYLIWSDLPNDRMLRYDDADGSVSVFRNPSGYSNGNTVDREGRLVTCEHGGRRVTRTEHDGSITVLADRHGGERLNSPNDVVVKSDGSIWFTDPDYGIVGDYEGGVAEREQVRQPCLSDRPRQRPGSTASPTTSTIPTGWRSRLTRSFSTSPTAAAPKAPDDPSTSVVSR